MTSERLICPNGIAIHDIRATSETAETDKTGVVVRLFRRSHGELLGEGFALLRDLSVEDLDRWVSALRASAPPALEQDGGLPPSR